ncbi:MAG: hypothetical protein U9R51_09420 [Actinomycetota bacterium]|nr:hypothetical protein [Actinomycetota bacterium]
MVPVHAVALLFGFLAVLAWILGALAGAAGIVAVIRVFGPDAA